MDVAGIQAKIDYGYRKAAEYIGRVYSISRPYSASDPMSLGNAQGTVAATIDSDPLFTFARLNTYGRPVFYAGLDASLVQAGDYLAGGQDTYFVAELPSLKPAMVVACNATVTFFRPGAAAISGGVMIADPTPLNAGAQPSPRPYNEAARPHDQQGDLLAASWPCSLLQGQKGERAPMATPEDSRRPWFAILLPSIPGIRLQTGDHMQDEDGTKYMISSAELSHLGYRLTAELLEVG